MTAIPSTAQVTEYRIQVCCMACEGPLAHVADGQPGQPRVIAECRPCERTYVIGAAIRDVTDELSRPSSDARKKRRKRDQARATRGPVTLSEALAAPATRVCKLPACDIEFTPARKDQDYCCDRHRHAANQRAYKARKRAVNDEEAA